jgi:hypothetical protein
MVSTVTSSAPCVCPFVSSVPRTSSAQSRKTGTIYFDSTFLVFAAADDFPLIRRGGEIFYYSFRSPGSDEQLEQLPAELVGQRPLRRAVGRRHVQQQQGHVAVSAMAAFLLPCFLHRVIPCYAS